MHITFSAMGAAAADAVMKFLTLNDWDDLPD
jgi:hypothetical protein